MSGLDAIDVRPLSVGFGVEIYGIDLATAAPPVLDAVLEAFNRFGAVVVRDQNLTPAAQVAFTRHFGPPAGNAGIEAIYAHPEHPEIYVISNKTIDGKRIGDPMAGQGWHTDLSYLEHPALCTMLYAMEVPPEGSDTCLADVTAAFAALPPERQAALDGLRIVHSYRLLAEIIGGVPMSDIDRLPDVTHPLVRTHPETGRKALWVSTGTTRGIEGMPNPEGLELLDELLAFATQERFVYRHKWRVGDLLVWDNRCTLHTGTPFDIERHTRHVHRTWVQGERPF